MDVFIVKLSECSNIAEHELLKFKKKAFTNRKKLLEHCFTYFMLDKLLKERYGLEDREIIFTNGKPMLKSGAKCFSLSHSGDFAAFAFSDFNCGIDIEEKKLRNFAPIARRMGFSCSTLDDFYKEWTLFEAKYKLGADAHFVHSFDYENYSVCAVNVNKCETVTL